VNKIEGDYSRLNILVADDSETVRNMMGRILESLGAPPVTLAGDGREALAIMGRGGQPIDIAFCDLQMPDMDGIEVVRRAAELPVPPAFAFVSSTHAAMLSAAANIASSRGIDVLGALAKPVSRNGIINILETYLNLPAGGTACSNVPGEDFSPTKADLEDALAHNQFELFYQPKYDLRNNAPSGFEALVRWRHPKHGLILPGRFIGKAERSELIGPLTDVVIASALKTSSSWKGAGLVTKISVNLAAHMLVDLELPDRFAALATEVGVDPRQIILEVTETGAFGNVHTALDILSRLYLKGFTLSIDDFGTGYSSMEQLCRVPFMEMKIDRAFVHTCAHNPRLRAVLESNTTLARILGMSTVAEGAETAEEVEVLRELGIDLVQGFYIAEPMPAGQAFAWAVDRAGSNTNGFSP